MTTISDTVTRTAIPFSANGFPKLEVEMGSTLKSEPGQAQSYSGAQLRYCRPDPDDAFKWIDIGGPVTVAEAVITFHSLLRNPHFVR